MQRFWQIISLVLLVQITPASACCLLPAAFEQPDRCCQTEEAPLPDSPAQPDVCTSDTIGHSQLPAAALTPAMLMVELDDLGLAVLRLHELLLQDAESVPLMTTAPPELRTTWVFVSRAALPARAPSELA